MPLAQAPALHTSEADVALVKNANDTLRKGGASKATSVAAGISDPVARKLVEWLIQSGIDTVAMESTGVYWIPFYQMLSDHGFQVCLVNARHVKNVPGRKTDVGDAQWLQYLHSVGLLRGSFRPSQAICALRSISRHRESLLKMGAVHIQHMQKALDQMNLHLHHVIGQVEDGAEDEDDEPVAGDFVIGFVADAEQAADHLRAVQRGNREQVEDAEIQALLAQIRSNAPEDVELLGRYSRAAADRIKTLALDRAQLAARPLPYERLDQLTIDLLLGMR